MPGFALSIGLCLALLTICKSLKAPSVARSRNAIALPRTRLYQMGGLSEKLGGIVEFLSGQTKITESNIEATLDEVKTILLDADVNLQVTNALIAKVKVQAIGMKVESGQKPGEQFISLLAAELVETMGKTQVPLIRRTDGRPNVILMCGLQGAGKTTACAKLVNWALRQSYAKKPLLVAADIYRPAAIEQLQTLGARIGIDVFSEGQGVNPVQVLFAWQYILNQGGIILNCECRSAAEGWPRRLRRDTTWSSSIRPVDRPLTRSSWTSSGRSRAPFFPTKRS